MAPLRSGRLPSGLEYRTALISFFVLRDSCQVPLSWNKAAGGDTVVWIGFELLHSSSKLGISQRLADWNVKMDSRNRQLEIRECEPLRGGPWSDHVCGRSLKPLCRFLTLHPRGLSVVFRHMSP